MIEKEKREHREEFIIIKDEQVKLKNFYVSICKTRELIILCQFIKLELLISSENDFLFFIVLDILHFLFLAGGECLLNYSYGSAVQPLFKQERPARTVHHVAFTQ